MPAFRTALFFAIILASASCSRTRVPAPAPVEAPAAVTTAPQLVESQAPRRIILFIGDGMGVGALTAATYSKGAPLAMFTMPHLAWMTTHEYEFLTTESASSATAIATGMKTHYEAVSVVPGTTKAQEENPETHLQTLHELASSLGLGAGLVATSSIIHATPAAFAAHRNHRRDYPGLAEDFAASDLDVLFGAGWKRLENEGGTDYLAAMKDGGWFVAKSPEELAARPPGTTRVAALFHPKDMPFVIDAEPRAMKLSDMVTQAVGLLDEGHPDGWMLMVEGSFVDWCGHNLDVACAAAETLDLDEAVATGLEYARGRSDTLVVVTADHETAGVSVIDPDYAARYAKVLGGAEAATALAAFPPLDGKPRPSPPPFQHIPIGSSTFELAAEPIGSTARDGQPRGTRDVWGMTELEDARATLVVGHLSMASRALWTKPDRFYGAHTPTMVPIFAEGAGARQVTAVRDNADLGKALRELISRGAADEVVTHPTPPDTRPRNVILFIGDGMGIPSVTGAYYHSGGLSMVDLPHQGIVATHAVDGLVNDSAASATAIATGERTRRGALGSAPHNGALAPLETVLERAERKGRRTGLVTTTSVTHATPAAFYAHRDKRGDTGGIVSDLVALTERVEGSDGIDVLLGGGASDFEEPARAALREQGYAVATSWPLPTEAVGAKKLLGLFAKDALPPATFRNNDDDPATPTLAELTNVALQRLDNPDGFFLMVEGGQIDWRLHEGRRDASVLDEVADFDAAIAAALDFAAQRNDTLIVVTADHDHTMTLLDNHYGFVSGRCGAAASCGGTFEMIAIALAVDGIRNGAGLGRTDLQGDSAPPRLHLQYAWPVQEARLRVEISAGHSANLVPLFAYGPWGGRFEGFLDQPQIGDLLMQWAK